MKEGFMHRAGEQAWKNISAHGAPFRNRIDSCLIVRFHCGDESSHVEYTQCIIHLEIIVFAYN